MLVWIAILWLLLASFFSFAEWSAKSKIGGFVVFSVIGSVLGTGFWAVASALAFVLFDLNWYANPDSMGSYVAGSLSLGVISGSIWAFVQINTKEIRRKYRTIAGPTN